MKMNEESATEDKERVGKRERKIQPGVKFKATLRSLRHFVGCRQSQMWIQQPRQRGKQDQFHNSQNLDDK